MDHSLPEAATAIGLVVLICFILYLVFRRYQLTMQAKNNKIDTLNRLLEKFGTAKEFVEFAQSPQGKKLLEEPAAPMSNPLGKVMRFVQAGIVFALIGVADVINGIRLSSATEINFVYERANAYYWGTLALAIGIGLILAGAVTHYLAKQWHLTNGSAKH